MKILSTILIFVVAGFAIVGIIHDDLFIVLRNFRAVKQHAQFSLVISICTGFVVSLLRD